MSSLSQDVQKHLDESQLEQRVTEATEDSLGAVMAIVRMAAKLGYERFEEIADADGGYISNHHAYAYLLMVAAHCEIAARMLERLDTKMIESN